MNRVDKAVALFEQGHACSQAILSVYGPLFGLDRDTAIRLAAGFAGGMRMGATCGAVTGAFMVLGLKLCTSDSTTVEGRQECYGGMQQFAARFRERNGSIVCSDLLGCDMSTSEGMQAARDQGLFCSICPKMVRDAAEILEEMLGETERQP